jgi:hypothetical protein
MASEIRFGLSRSAYDAVDAEHFSVLKHFRKTAAHYLHAKQAGFKDTKSKSGGRAAHVATLEPEKFDAEYVVYLGERRGNAWKEFQAANAAREILTETEADLARAIAKAVRADPIASKYLRDGHAEASMFWEAGGFKCKGRIDYASPLALVDLKITKDASPEGFGREVWNYQSHVQAAWYGDGWVACEREPLPFVLIAVEPVEPHFVGTYVVQDWQLEAGRRTYRGWLEQLAFCTSQNDFPGYASAEMELQMPRNAINEMEAEAA